MNLSRDSFSCSKSHEIFKHIVKNRYFFGLFINNILTDCPDKIPVNWWVSLVPTRTMKTVSNSRRKAGFEVRDGFYHENSRTLLY